VSAHQAHSGLAEMQAPQFLLASKERHFCRIRSLCWAKQPMGMSEQIRNKINERHDGEIEEIFGNGILEALFLRIQQYRE
jgi:hypothetical protein